MTSPTPSPSPSPASSPAGDDDLTRPGPALRWSGDGGLARRNAPLWGGDEADAARAEGPEAVQPPAASRPAPVVAAGAESRPLATSIRRLSAWMIDYMVKTFIFFLIISFARVEVGETPWANPELVVASALLNAGYAFIFGIHGVTPAAYLLKIRIVALGGDEPGVRRSLVRAAGASLNEAFLFVGSLMMFFDPRRQTLHDKLAGTIVVDEAESARR